VRAYDGHLLTLVAVLDDVRRHGETARAEIMARTGLGRTLVTQRIADLQELGLVSAGDLGASTGGRAPRNVRFRPDTGRVLAADLGATGVDVALADLAGTLLAHRREDVEVTAGPESVLGSIGKLFDDVLAESDDRQPVWGVGVGVPGPVEFGSGRVVAPPIMPGWADYPIREYFAERYHAPTWVDNDVNVLMLGELRAGAARGHSNAILVKLATGIGAGIVVDGRLCRGAQGSAGDVGHTQARRDSTVACRCGKVGCLEALAGGLAMAREGMGLAAAGNEMLARRLQERGKLDAADVLWAAARGDQASVELVGRCGVLIGEMLSTAVHFFNPALIVLGGRVAAASDVLLATIRQTVYAQSLPFATRRLEIKGAELGADGGVIGVATMVVDELLSPGRLSAWIPAGSPAGAADIAAQPG
jgi:glucokinase-like ROK family protein